MRRVWDNNILSWQNITCVLKYQMKERKFYKIKWKDVMFCETFCAAIQGIDGCMIQVEADVSDGLPCFSMVGFLASEVKEAKERVSIALLL